MREEQYRKIDGTDYVCRPLPGWDGVGLFFDLVAMIGEPAMMMITRAFSESGKVDDDGNPVLDEDGNPVGIDADAGEIVGAGVYSFVSKLSAARGVGIMKQVFAEVKTGDGTELGNDADFNLHFKGETFAALRVFVWALQVNYQSFLDGSRLSGILGKLQGAATKAAGAAGEASSPETSPPSSQSSASMQTEAQI